MAAQVLRIAPPERGQAGSRVIKSDQEGAYEAHIFDYGGPDGSERILMRLEVPDAPSVPRHWSLDAIEVRLANCWGRILNDVLGQ